MLNLNATRISRSEEMRFLPAFPPTAAGQALVQGASGTVKPGTGAAGELFVGVALSQPLTLTNYPKVEELIGNASGVITLARTPIGGTLRVVAMDTGTVLVAGNPASVATEYSIAGTVLTQNVARAAKPTRVFYHFVPDAIDQRFIQGDVQPGNAASLTTGTIGVVKAGTVFTSEFDTTVDWNTANPAVKVGASARFTIGGTGAAVPQAQVMSAPTAVDSLLGLYFSA